MILGDIVGDKVVLVLGEVVLVVLGFLPKRRNKCRLRRIKKCLRNNHFVIEKKRFRHK